MTLVFWPLLHCCIIVCAVRSVRVDTQHAADISADYTTAIGSQSERTGLNSSRGSLQVSCEDQLAQCKALSSSTEHAQECQLRYDACHLSPAYFGQFHTFKSPCTRGSLELEDLPGQLQLSWFNTCGDDRRELSNLFLNIDRFNTSKAQDAITRFLYQEISDTLKEISCGIHASYKDNSEKYRLLALKNRGMDRVSLINVLVLLAQEAFPGLGHVGAHMLNHFALGVLRELWFQRPGDELVGLRFNVQKEPRPHPMFKCSAPIFDAHELWEITDFKIWQDDTFPQYPSGAPHHVLRCVSGACQQTGADGVVSTAPPVILRLQSTLHEELRAALNTALQDHDLQYTQSEESFIAFVRKLSGAKA